MRLPAALRAPLAVLAGTRAVLERDFVVLTSLRRFVAMRTAAIITTALIVGAVLLGMEGDQPDEIGQSVLFAVAMAVPALVLLLAPPLAAPSIATERAVQTLDLVLAAPVTAASFVLAKFLSRLLTVLVLILATMPVASLALIYGGVAPALFLEVYALTFAFAVLGVAAGVFASAFSRRVAAAVLRAYSLAVVAPILWVVGAWAATSVVHRHAGSVPFPQFDELVEPSPLGTWFQVLVHCESSGAPTLLVWRACWILFALSALGLALAAWRMQREAAFRTARGKSRRSRRLHLPFGRPALSRIVRGSLMSRPTSGTIAFTLLVLVGWGLSLWGILEEGGRDGDWWHLTVLVSLTAVLVLRALAAAAANVAEQRQQGSLPLLLATPVTTRDVVHDAFAGAYWSVLPFLVLGTAHAAVAAAAGPLLHEAALAWFVTTIVYVGLAAAVGLRVAVTASTAGRAVLRAFALFVGGSVVICVLGLLVAIVVQDMEEGAMYWFGMAPAVTLVGAPTGTLGTVTSHSSSDPVALSAMGFWLIVHAAAIPPLLASAVRHLRPERE